MQLNKKIREIIYTTPTRQTIDRKIRQMAKEVAKAAPKPGEIKVAAFNASTRITGLSQNAAFAMLTAWSLSLQGINVKNFVCQRGMTRCVMGTDQDDIYKLPPCQKCLRQSAAIYDRTDLTWMDFLQSEALAKDLQNKDLAALRYFEYEEIPLGELCLPSMRWILRCHNLPENKSTEILYRHYLLSAYKVAKQFNRFIQKTKPVSAMVFNGMQFPEAAARWVAHQYDLPVYSYEVGLRPFSAFFTEGEATAYPVNIADDFHLTPAQDDQLDAYLSKRFEGDFTMAGVQFWPEMVGLDENIIGKINAFKQVVPIFTNVIFDTSQPHANVVFSDMFKWLDRVLRVIKAHPETLFVIRAHPDESRPGKSSRESVEDWVHNRNADALPNVIFIRSEDPFSSYEMIQRAKFVMIYNSTIGMEASIMGKPVLCAGKARFTQLETVFFPKTQREYLSKLKAFLREDTVQCLDEHRLNARRFLYFQLFKTSLPFDQFLEPDGIWPGFVRLKEFSWQDLLPENSTTLKVVSEGLINGKEFTIPDD